MNILSTKIYRGNLKLHWSPINTTRDFPKLGKNSICKMISFLFLWKNGSRLLKHRNFLSLLLSIIKTFNMQLQLIFCYLRGTNGKYLLLSNFFLITLSCYFIYHHLHRIHYVYFYWMTSQKNKGCFLLYSSFEESNLNILVRGIFSS